MEKRMDTKKDFSISRKFGRALKEFAMLEDEDTIAVGMSGGKDSYTLLDLFHKRQKGFPVKYDVVAVHIDYGLSENQTQNIIKFCEDRKVKYVIQKEKLEIEKGREVNCFYCSWIRRTSLFKFVHKLGIKKLALGHHMNDLVETIFLNMFYQSKFESFLPTTKFFKGEFHLIRPLVHAKNSEIIDYAIRHKFPFEKHKCPFGIESERNSIREMIQNLEKKDPLIINNIFNSWIKTI